MLAFVPHESVLQLSDVLLNFFELLFLHDKLFSDESHVISAFVLFHDWEHVFELLTELFVILGYLDFLLIVVNQNPDPFLNEGNAVRHVKFLFWLLDLKCWMLFLNFSQANNIRVLKFFVVKTFSERLRFPSFILLFDTWPMQRMERIFEFVCVFDIQTPVL